MDTAFAATPDLPVPLSAIRSAFGLSGPLDVVAFHPGASGAWRLSVARGPDISVKLLSAASPEFQLEQLRMTADLEGRALRADLPIVPPLEPVQTEVGLATRIGDHLVWAHGWVEETNDPDPAAIHRWAGETAARLHELWPTLRSQEDHLAQAYGLHNQDDWQGWIDDAYRANLAWTTDVSGIMPSIREASRLVRAALRHPDLERCISHRDLNPPNVLATVDGPRLCDFGYSGMEVPWLELVDAAHSFGQADPVTIESYRRAGGAAGPETIEALAREAGATMNFLTFNMWLSLGHRPVSEEKREEATARIPGLATDLSTQVESWESMRRMLFGR
ncbi:MAG: aminoglycoside phosphotransferase family protein [Chloroflexota bacterium]|nr:aminoglycoside phosphotransferase family protein [Chloroflexota bacterium]